MFVCLVKWQTQKIRSIGIILETLEEYLELNNEFFPPNQRNYTAYVMIFDFQRLLWVLYAVNNAEQFSLLINNVKNL